MWCGAQEVSAIAFAQLIHPLWTAKLVQFESNTTTDATAAGTTTSTTAITSAGTGTGTGTGSGSGISWHTESFSADSERAAYHALKMTSKDTRPATQMAVVGGGVPPGEVLHMVVTVDR